MLAESKIEILVLIIIFLAIFLNKNNHSLDYAEYELMQAYECAERGRAKNRNDLHECVSDAMTSRYPD
jgi:hypothetical protein